MPLDAYIKKTLNYLSLYIAFDHNGQILDFGGNASKFIKIEIGDNLFNLFVLKDLKNNEKIYSNSKNIETDVSLIYKHDSIFQYNSRIEYFLKYDCYVLSSNENASLISFSSSPSDDIKFINLLQLLLTEDNRSKDVDLQRALNYYRNYGINNDIFQKIVLTTHDSVTFSDIRGNVIWCNQAFANLTGLPKDKIMGKRPRESMYGKGSVYIDKGFVDKNVAQKEPFYFENIAYNSAGNEYWFSAKVFPVICRDEVIGRIHIMRDISNVKLSELDIEKNKNLLKIATDASNAGIWAYNMPLNQLEISDELKSLLSLDYKEKYSIRDLLKMINHSDRLNIYNLMTKIINPENANIDLEIRLLVNHVTLYFHFKGKCIQFDTANRPILFVGTLIDVTHYKEMIRKVEHQREFYNKILDQIPSDIVIWDTHHRYKYINASAIKNQSIRSWLIDKDDFDYCELKGHDRSLAVERRKQFEELLTNKTPIRFVEKFENEKTTYKLRIMYPVIKNDIVEYVIGYGVDITEQIENERLAKSHAEIIGNTLDITNDGIAKFSYEGIFIEGNRAFYHIFNLKKQDSVGKKIKDLIPFELHNNINRQIKRLFLSPTKKRRVVKTVIKGDERYIDYSIINVVNHQNISHVVVSFTDVTDIVNRENILRASIDKEVELNKYKTQFLRITSHELRTPLAVIKSSSELIQYYFENQQTPNKYNKYLYNILHKVDEMTDLLNQLMLVNKMTAGEVKIDIKQVGIYSFVSDVIKAYQPFNDRRHLKVVLQENDTKAFFDSALMKIALNNLLNNAFKYSYGKQEPILTVFTENNNLVISVKDFGIGIPDADMKNLFKSFYRASNAISITGSGVGLTIVDFIAKMHSGSVALTSNLGNGSEFIIRIPQHHN